MSDQPRDLGDEEINEAGPEPSKEASSPLYATANPTNPEDAGEGSAEEEVEGEG